MLKTFLNNKIILGILSLMHENKSIIEFQENVEILNNFFTKQLSTVIFLQLLKRKQRSPFQQITLQMTTFYKMLKILAPAEHM